MKNLLLLLAFTELINHTQGQTVAFASYHLNKGLSKYSTASASSEQYGIKMGRDRKNGFIVLGSSIAVEAAGVAIALENSNYGGRESATTLCKFH